jgi:hypothetical protein
MRVGLEMNCFGHATELPTDFRRMGLEAAIRLLKEGVNIVNIYDPSVLAASAVQELSHARQGEIQSTAFSRDYALTLRGWAGCVKYIDALNEEGNASPSDFSLSNNLDQSGELLAHKLGRTAVSGNQVA